MAELTLNVTGMTCGHCAAHVTEELEALDNVTGVDVNLVKGGTSTVKVTTKGEVTDAQLAEAIDEAGNYQLESVVRA